MKTCSNCCKRQPECFYKGWNQCISCRDSDSDDICWPILNLKELISGAKRLQELTRNAENHYLTLKSEQTESSRRQNESSDDGDDRQFGQRIAIEKARDNFMGQVKKEHEEVSSLLYTQSCQNQSIVRSLVDTLLLRCQVRCDRCIKLEKLCELSEGTQLCRACTEAGVRCSGCITFKASGFMGITVDELNAYIDSHLPGNLEDTLCSQSLQIQMEQAEHQIKQHLGRSDLLKLGLRSLSRGHNESYTFGQAYRHPGSASICDNAKCQELRCLREVLTSCRDILLRWESAYFAELGECPVRRGLSSVDEMTDTESAYPEDEYDGSLPGDGTKQSSPGLNRDMTINTDEASPITDIATWYRMAAKLQELEKEVEKIQNSLEQCTRQLQGTTIGEADKMATRSVIRFGVRLNRMAVTSFEGRTRMLAQTFDKVDDAV